MAQTIKIKNSGTSGNTPSSLAHGELALNYNDGKLFYKNASGSIVEFTTSATGSFLPLSGGTLTGTLLGTNAAFTGKVAVGNSGVHSSYHFYNNQNSYFNGSVVIDDALSITGSNAALSVAGAISITDGSASAPAIRFSNDSDTGMYRFTDTLAFTVNGQRKAYVTAAGLFSDNNVYVVNGGQFRTFAQWTASTGGTGYGFTFTNTQDNTTPLTISSDGNGVFAGTLTATKFIQSASTASNFYAGQFSRSGSTTTTPDIWGTNSTFVIGTSSTTEALAFTNANAEFYGNVTVNNNLYIGDGNDGYFFNDTNGRTAFANGQFYFQNSVSTFYNYAPNQYHGDSSGTTHYFRSNVLNGTGWNINGAGKLNTRDHQLNSSYHLQRSDHHSGHLEGSYNNVGANGAKTNPIYTIGSSYNPNDSSLGNMYGVGFASSASASYLSFTGASNWGLYVAADGDARVFLDGSAGVVTSTGQHYVGSNVVWNAGNDGAGSGLDADTLDGYNSAENGNSVILRTQSNGYLDINNWINIGNKGLYSSTNGHHFYLDGTGYIAKGGSSSQSRIIFQLTNGTNQGIVLANSSGYVGFQNASGSWLFQARSNGNLYKGNGTGLIWHAANDGSGSGLDADLLDGQQGSYYLDYNNFSNTPSQLPASGGNADTVDNLHANNSSNTAADALVRTQANGYIFTPFINTTSGDAGTTTPTRFYASYDNYIRYYDWISMKSFMNSPYSRNLWHGREQDGTSDTNYHTGSIGWGSTFLNDTTAWDVGSGFLDNWSQTGANSVGSSGSHFLAMQAMHYSAGTSSSRYGFRIINQAGTSNLYFQRTWNSGVTTNRIWNAGTDGSGSGLDADTLDGYQSSYFATQGNLGNYLPLSGGTLTGNITTSGSILTTLESSTAIKSRFIMGKASGSTANGVLYLQYGSAEPVYIGAGSGGAGLNVAGEIEGGSLDINGNADITGQTVIVGPGTTGSTLPLNIKDNNATNIFRIRDDGVVLIDKSYLYVTASAGAYIQHSLRARGGITNDGGNTLNISSGSSEINFSSKNLVGIAAITTSSTISAGSTIHRGNMTIDSQEIDVSSGDLALDVAGNITLDAGGGNIDLKEGGTTFGRLQEMIGGLGISAGSTPTFAQLISSTKTLFFGHIELGDSKHVRWGNGSGDLQIYHDGSNSYIEEYGTGDLIISSSVLRPRTDAFILNNAANSQHLITASNGSSVFLYNAGSEKFRTHSYGGSLTGSLAVSQQVWSGGSQTASSPAYAFNNDTNTGMFRKSSDVIGFSTGGQERATIDSDGLKSNGVSVATVEGGSTSKIVTMRIQAKDLDSKITGGGYTFYNGGTNKLLIIEEFIAFIDTDNNTNSAAGYPSFAYPIRVNVKTKWGAVDSRSHKDGGFTITKEALNKYFTSDVTMNPSGETRNMKRFIVGQPRDPVAANPDMQQQVAEIQANGTGSGQNFDAELKIQMDSFLASTCNATFYLYFQVKFREISPSDITGASNMITIQ